MVALSSVQTPCQAENNPLTAPSLARAGMPDVPCILSAMNRRAFLEAAGVAPIVAVAGARVPATSPQSTTTDRDRWVTLVERLAAPVLGHLAEGRLRQRMPVEQAAGSDRSGVTHLEAVGRLLNGIAPWLEASGLSGVEAESQARFRRLAVAGLSVGLDPASPDALNFTRESQPLVDAAFLAQALVRAPRSLRDALDQPSRTRLVAALRSTRGITPGFNNWLLFSAMVEAGLKTLTAEWDRVRVDYAVRQHDQWYKGDGLYGDGPSFHWDYYNSFVIQPMLLDVLDVCAGEVKAWDELALRALERAGRYAAILERLVAPDGSFPAIGRSIAYRGGAFHLLAHLALRRKLPADVTPAQARGALTAVIRRTLEAPETFDAGGWLRIGLAGHQPGIGERYISTGSLYLCAAAFLPLGLPPTDPFWAAPAEPFTGQRAWSGAPFPIDHAI
jgi:hypothetical protein